MTDSDSNSARHRSGSETRRRPHLIPIRVSEGERAELARRADATGISIAAFIRERALDTPPPRMRPRPKVEIMYLARLLGQIGKMGSNLNQVAKWANADRKFSEADLRVITRLDEELRDLRGETIKAMGREG